MEEKAKKEIRPALEEGQTEVAMCQNTGQKKKIAERNADVCH